MKSIEVELMITQKKSGRPRAISDDLIPLVLSLYESGLGYRAIARELINQGICADWSTVRRVVKKWPSKTGNHNSSGSSSDTILTRGKSED